MISRSIIRPVLAAAGIALVFAFETKKLNDGDWQHIKPNTQGSCPTVLRIDTEKSTFGTKEVKQDSLVGGKEDLKACTGIGKVTLTKDPKTGGTALQKAITASKDSGQIQAGAQSGALTCGKLVIPDGSFWQFFTSKTAFKIAKPTPTLVGKEGVNFEKDATFLVLADKCIYQQSKGKLSNKAKCFASTATVELQSGHVRRMDELSVGDRVKVGPAEYSRVFIFTHKLAEATNDFVILSASSGEEIALTSGHFIYANGDLVPAGEVRLGDVLRLGDGTESRVSSVSKGQLEGLYNPQTVTGDIIVNGVTASTYTTAVEPRFAHAVLAPFRALSHAFGFDMTALESGGGVLTGLAPRGQAAL